MFSVWSSMDRVANSLGVMPPRLVWGRAVSDLTLDKVILTEAAKGNF